MDFYIIWCGSSPAPFWKYAPEGGSPEEMEPLLLSRDRTLAGKTASPWGLYLDRVFYSREELTQALMEEARGKA